MVGPIEAPSRACVVIPTYNEKDNIAPLVAAIAAQRTEGLSVLFVDDSSPDGTAGEIRRVAQTASWVELLLRDGKKGIGSAYQEGFLRAIETHNPAVLVEMDADLQHPASALARLVEAVEGGADVAICSRYIPGGEIAGWGRIRRFVSKGANAYSRFMLGLTVKDATSGFRAYSRDAALEVATADLPAKGFEFQVASLHVLKARARFVEVPYEFSIRMAGKSKLGTADTVRFFFAVLRLAFSRSHGSKTEIRETAAAK